MSNTVEGSLHRFFNGRAALFSTYCRFIIATSRRVDVAVAFIAEVDGKPVTLELIEGEIRDNKTVSVWNSIGQAIEGQH